MFKTKLKISFPLLLTLLLWVAGCDKPASKANVPTRETALEHFKQLEVDIIPDDNGQVLSLLLAGKQIADADLLYANSFPELKYISLSKTSIGDEGLQHLLRLGKLEKLYLRKTDISDAGLLHLQKLNQLIILDISETNVTVDGLLQLRSLENLDRVLLSGTSITEEEITRLKQSMPHCQFSR